MRDNYEAVQIARRALRPLASWELIGRKAGAAGETTRVAGRVGRDA